MILKKEVLYTLSNLSQEELDTILVGLQVSIIWAQPNTSGYRSALILLDKIESLAQGVK